MFSIAQGFSVYQSKIKAKGTPSPRLKASSWVPIIFHVFICVCLLCIYVCLVECGNCRSLKWGIYDGDDDDLLCYQTQIGYLLFYFYDHHLSSMISYPYTYYIICFSNYSSHLPKILLMCWLYIMIAVLVCFYLFIKVSALFIGYTFTERAHTHTPLPLLFWISSTPFQELLCYEPMIAMRTLASNH